METCTLEKSSSDHSRYPPHFHFPDEKGPFSQQVEEIFSKRMSEFKSSTAMLSKGSPLPVKMASGERSDWQSNQLFHHQGLVVTTNTSGTEKQSKFSNPFSAFEQTFPNLLETLTFKSMSKNQVGVLPSAPSIEHKLEDTKKEESLTPMPIHFPSLQHEKYDPSAVMMDSSLTVDDYLREDPYVSIEEE